MIRRSIFRTLVLLVAGACGCGTFSARAGSEPVRIGSELGARANGDPHVLHCLATLNRYRAQHGVPPLALDDRITEFSLTASQWLQASGKPHGYFTIQSAGPIWQQGFCSSAGENQTGADWNVGPDADATIDVVLQAMMNEGPGGGHYENILNPKFVRVGIGIIVTADGRFFMTNDFSSACAGPTRR